VDEAVFVSFFLCTSLSSIARHRRSHVSAAVIDRATIDDRRRGINTTDEP
jgi:hypothetical protein